MAALLGAGLPSIDATGGYSGLSPRFLPTVVTIALAACAGVLLAGRSSVPDAGAPAALEPLTGDRPAVDRHADDEPSAERSSDDMPAAARPGDDSPAARLLTLVAALLLHMAVIGSIGFVAAGTLLLVLVARGFGSRRPARDALVGLALTVPLWLVFTRLLGLALPLFPALRL